MDFGGRCSAICGGNQHIVTIAEREREREHVEAVKWELDLPRSGSKKKRSGMCTTLGNGRFLVSKL